MKKIVNNLVMMVVTQVFESYKKNSVSTIKIELVKGILSSADAVRMLLQNLVSCMAFVFAMAMGAVLLLNGIILFLAMFLYDTLPDWFSIIPLTLVIGGFVCFVFVWYQIYNVLLSEQSWMQMIKNNKLVGKLVRDVLDNVKSNS